MADQTLKTNKPIFNTPFGLLIYFSKKQYLQYSEKIDLFLSLLKLEKIPFYLIKSEDFSLTIAQILNNLKRTNLQALNYKNLYSVSDELRHRKSAKIKQNPKLKACQNKNQQNDNILFFSGFTRDQVEDFLEKIRHDKYPKFPLKAVTTKNNYNFSFDKLIIELTQDRIVVSHVINLRNRINALTKHLATNNNLNSQQKKILQKEIDQAENLLKDVETNFDLELFQTQIHKFNYLLSKIKRENKSEKPQPDNVH